MISLTRIRRDCANVGGIRRMWIAAACDLAQDLAHTDFVLANQNAASLPATFVQYEFERNTASYEENWELTNLGIAPREMTIRCFINKTSAVKLAEMGKLTRGRGFVVVFEDNNRLLRMMGTKRHPARLAQLKSATGDHKGSAHGYTLAFSAYPQPEPFFLPLPVEPPIEPLNDRNRETIHLRGDLRQRAVQFTDFVYELEVVNIFDSALNIHYQFSQAALPNWTNTATNPILTFSQMEALALNAAPPFWINFRIDGYNQTISDAFLLFNYRGPSTGGNMVLNFAGISQDNYIGLREKISLGTPTISAGVSLLYNVRSSPTQSFLEYPLTTIAQVNSAIAALPNDIGYVVGVYAVYSGTTVSGTASFPITYL